ncbi:ferric uptake regulation protein [candidate division WOR_3 bacterium SM23_42]|uniref:Ferric uptake regulation protein n=1 Tax=candidate division WOR_3 bacterium SM23_42 TaxID=1703779 RepID=A0A0S8FW93_UNCW3|nr:MAG: ferric uptake regulation protein [candidate division WOR_3 bacterium SM23_42]
MPRRDHMGPPWWHGRFRGHGYRITVAREAILDVLSQTEEHLSAEDVYLTVHKSYPNVGLTTVYRTLELLVHIGLVFKFDFGDGRARYELSEGPKGTRHHHHLVCTNCGRVIDYTDFIDDEIELLGRAEKGLSDKFNFRITNHLIQFYGLCDRCQKKT